MEDILNDIISEFNFTTINEDYFYFDDLFNKIPVANQNFYINQLLNIDYYKIKNTDRYYQTPELRNSLIKKSPSFVPWPNALDDEKKLILQMTFHPGRHHFDKMKSLFFDKIMTDRVVQRLQNKSMYLFLYFGFEADSFSSKEFYEYGNIETYYELFDTIFDEYNLPKNSIIILSSNLLGEQQEIEYYKNKEKRLATIFDNVYEDKTFTEVKGDINLDYTFDDYIKNVKNSKHTILRTSRTQHYLRDIMLYWLIESDLIKTSIVEQNKFYDNKLFEQKLAEIRKLFFDANHNHKYLFDLNRSTIDGIKSKLPFVASDYEKETPVAKNRIYSNEVIPHDIYYKTIYSWVSTSIPDRFTQVFINSSTFNPILYYHPLLWNGNPYTIKSFVDLGFKSYDFIFDESHDNIEYDLERLFISIQDVENKSHLSVNDWIDILNENKEVMIHNRELLFECQSVTRIIKKLHNYICE